MPHIIQADELDVLSNKIEQSLKRYFLDAGRELTSIKVDVRDNLKIGARAIPVVDTIIQVSPNYSPGEAWHKGMRYVEAICAIHVGEHFANKPVAIATSIETLHPKRMFGITYGYVSSSIGQTRVLNVGL